MNKKFLQIIFFSLLFFIVHLTLNIEHCEAQWYQINLPVSGSVYQIQFINSNTGWMTTQQSYTAYTLLKTTNAGLNWQSVYSDGGKVQNIQFINDTLGYARGYSSADLLLKTTNSGYNWNIIQSSSSLSFTGFYMANSDTGWVNVFYNLGFVVLRTINGFQTFENICDGPGGPIAKLYFFKEKYNGEYCGYMSGNGLLWRTTNSGYNWAQINPSGTLYGFSFINKDTGWIDMEFEYSKLYRTINGGQNWVLQYYDSINYNRFSNIYAVNFNKVWCGSGFNYILASNNGGNTWGKQSSPISTNSHIYMYDTSFGFAWSSYLVRTTNGGGPISNVINNNEQIVKNYRLYQNFPNPFNSVTIIRFQIKDLKFVKLKIYNILGKEVATLVNEKLSRGVYEIKWNASGFPSGIYFYSLYINDIKTDTKRMVCLK